VRRAAAAVVLACLAAALAPSARGQTSDAGPAERWQISAFGGVWNPLTTAPYLYRTPAQHVEVGFGSAAAYGLSAGLNMSSSWGLELSWMQTNPAQQYTGSPPVKIRDVTMNIFELDGLWYLRRGAVQPYVLFGVGGSSTGSSFGGTNFTGIVGLGVKAFLSRHFAVRADVRFDASYGNVGSPGEPAFCDAAGCYYYRSSWYWSLPVTAGLTFAF